MSKKITIPKATVGFGYVGEWSNGDVGWWMPEHCYKYYRQRNPIEPNERWHECASKGQRAFLCRITVTPVTDKLGRPITTKQRKVTP